MQNDSTQTTTQDQLAAALPRTAEVLLEEIASGRSPGVQLYVSLAGRVVADAALGEARPGVAMTPATLTVWFSAGKPLGSVALAQLWESGRLDLDRPVAEWIPEFAQGGKEAITPRHILTHSAGLRAVLGLRDDMPWDEAIDRICRARIEPGWVPGETFGYHPKTTWYLVGELVRRIDGRPWPDYAREAICAPLAMVDTWSALSPERLAAYGDRIGALVDTDPHRPLGMPNPAEGWETPAAAPWVIPGVNNRGPVRELARLYEALLSGGALPGPPRTRILAPETVRKFTAVQVHGAEDKSFKRRINWGLGFILNSAEWGLENLPYGYGAFASPRTFGHGGRETAMGLADPERGLALAFAFNGMPGEARHQRRLRAVCDAIYADLGFETP